MSRAKLALFDPKLFWPAISDSFRKLSPAVQLHNPVMFVCYVGSIATTLLLLKTLAVGGGEPVGFILSIALWLWFTVLFANFAEALAEGRSKAQAASLRSLRKTVEAKKLAEPRHGSGRRLVSANSRSRTRSGWSSLLRFR